VLVPPLAAVPNLERELDALYALTPEEFVAGRNDLAARLRRAHQTDAAESVRALRRPTVAVWAVNRLARAHPDLVAELVEAGARLRTVQQHALAGRGSQADVAEATERERDALRALVATARAELGTRASPQVVERVSQTLRAAAIEEEAGRLLAAGRLTDELHPVGFGPLEAVAPRRRPEDAAARAAARERLKELRAEARRLAADAARAVGAADVAEREAARLRREADELRAAAARAAAAVDAATGR
jgi:hypothetical protein